MFINLFSEEINSFYKIQDTGKETQNRDILVNYLNYNVEAYRTIRNINYFNLTVIVKENCRRKPINIS